MDIALLTERYAAQIAGVLSCWDRVLIFGTLPKICFAAGMTSYLYERKVRIFDYPRFAEPFRNELRENAERLAAESGLEIEFIRKRNFRKEDRIKEVLARRGDHSGLVHVFSAMEPCSTYKPWHDKSTGRTFLKPDDGKCLHYYFYFLDEELGLCYVCLPGCPAGCRSTSTGIIGWPPSCASETSIARSSITLSPASPTGRGRSRWPTACASRSCTASWMSSPAASVPSIAVWA